MQLEISKTDYDALLQLIDRATTIIKCKNPTTREYNVVRRLGLIRKKMARKTENYQNGTEV